MQDGNCRRAILWSLAFLLMGSTLFGALPSSKKPDQEAGEFLIFHAGREIGAEKFVIIKSDQSIQSSSVLEFRNPEDSRQKVHIETKLSMTAHFVPLSYELESEVGGKKGRISGKFSPNQVIFEYSGSQNSTRRGLLVGERYTILDTNVFHHFVFLTRAYLENSRDNMRRYEVLIPQENESGFLRIKDLGKESIDLKGKSNRARHLEVDSGSLVIDLWIDDSDTLQKIAVPTRQIEVTREK